jgi:uncharacterized membrane protein
MLGWCMVLLAGLVWLPTWAVAAIGLLVIALQSGFALPGAGLPEPWRMAWEFIYPIGAEVKLGTTGPSVAVLYTIVPWIGVMAAGYGFGAVMLRDEASRHKICLAIGLVATALFVVIAGLEVVLGSAPENAPPALFRFLNQRKYPASVPFLLMTLGPAIAVLPVAERARGWVAEALATFGRVPMFYYLLHIPLIHATAAVIWLMRDGTAHSEWFATAPFVSVPPDRRWGLTLLYLVFVIDVAILYFPCAWFARVKAQRRGGWLSYV